MMAGFTIPICLCHCLHDESVAASMMKGGRGRLQIDITIKKVVRGGEKRGDFFEHHRTTVAMDLDKGGDDDDRLMRPMITSASMPP